ncbi:MAG: bifunctional 5,10-methylenetetrahydrofolate dehydrogenase/5,10-methenyltetrahydrofolate cyclohydrolase [Candidatus Omnitrophica bacterium]|nr:bifunctional 5,10-methylenetetrahydrofolate dehydrogenase/5,10-methenyltetrahydrofolate cyclohydrolase [Candidatus Omnitrophota bacterium]
MAVKIDGRKIAESLKRDLKNAVASINKRDGCTLKLAALLIGSNASSELYMKSQKNLAAALGIEYNPVYMAANTGKKRIEKFINKLNNDATVTGVIVQRPVPANLDFLKLCQMVSPSKDVEGLNPANIGRLIYGESSIVPCAAGACMKILDSLDMPLEGKEIVVVGHSETVGKPLSLMLLSKMATTTVCHIGTYKRGLLKHHVGGAEVLIVSVGKPNLINGSWVRKGAVVIDVGINKLKNRVVGDVDFDSASKKASYITPVPGGVGPVTSVILMKNLVALYKNRSRKAK